MKLTQKNIRIITTLSIAALMGLVVLQYYLLRNAYDYRQEAFERNVHAAMTSIVQKLETAEAVGNVLRIAVTAAPQSHEANQSKKMRIVHIESDSLHWVANTDTFTTLKLPPFAERMPLHIQNNAIRYFVHSPQHVTLRVFDLVGKKDTVLVDSFKEPGEYTINCIDPDFSKGEFVVKYWADSNSFTMHAVNGASEGVVNNASVNEQRENILNRVIDNLSFTEKNPIERRVRPSLLDSVVNTTLKEAGIDLPYAYGVLGERNDSLRLFKPAGYEKELRSSDFRSRLYPNDIFFNKNQLALYFPNQSVYVLKQVGPILGLTIFCMSIVVFCFAYTIRTIIRQKQFAVRLTDFINNMTHEFKTPISTIAVATETLLQPNVNSQQEKVLLYSGVIQDENLRMRKQVDKILQMAVLEEGDYELTLSDVDVHEIIRKAVGNIALQVEAKEGSMLHQLSAEHSVIRADAVHLANIVHNILDNANKYSPETPNIMISTSNSSGNIIIDVIDQGIGMSHDDTKRVFDKYYRVHTGNVHDVKGFGLGLSYVKLMVDAHGGSVSLESELGKGTTVSLRFPVLSNENV
jgi:two-component system phosphate regulon sensor histidine kinase PhoR